MIDFRYHLVSIISIFLALAVGIVLGAGPLQQNLGTQLADQVSALRTEKQVLNQRLTAAEAQVAAGQEYATAVTGRVVEGRLAGHGVVVIQLPAAESKLGDTLKATLAQAGATVTATVTLSDDWFDPGKADARDTAATAAATALGLTSASTGDALLGEVLARIVVTKDVAEQSASRTAALDVLSSAGLLTSSEAQIVPGDLAVIVSGDFAGTQQFVDAQTRAILSLVRVVAGGARCAIVAGGSSVVAAGQPVTSDAVQAVRQDSETSAIVSTVDHARDGSGPAVAVLAIESALAGTVGHFGTADGATATLPKVAP